MTQFLISGASSGFGKYCLEELQGNKFIRNDLRFDETNNPTDIIIHCGWGKINNLNIFDYIKEARKNIYQLRSREYKKLIFLSSIDVYPKNKQLHTEHEDINPNDICGIYGLTKLIIEKDIQIHCPNYLILRCGALLGKYTPKNNIRKAIEGGKITISHKSTFNLIRYKQVLDFIQIAIDKDLTGIYNIVANDNIKFKEISHIKTYGYKYITPEISYEKLFRTMPHLAQSSYFNYQNWINTDL